MPVIEIVPELIMSLFPGGGFFIEAGAHDGIGDSFTYKLEQVGWDGLCVEPSSAFNGLMKSRKCYVSNSCLGKVDRENVIFREVEGNAIELSGIISYFYDSWDRETRPHKDIPLVTTSLTTLLKAIDAPSVIQFMCLDTEGSELDILRGHDFKSYLILSMLVEYNGNLAKFEELGNFLLPLGYVLYTKNGSDLLFVHESMSCLLC